MTLQLTFLGHQSWLVTAADVAVLIDPILGSHIGATLRLPVHPPREICVDALPPIDLIVLSHEHNDHTELSSLDRLDRSIPVLVAPLMPAVVVRAIEALGFAVHRAHHGEALTAGPLSLVLLPGGADAPVSEERVAQILITEDNGPAVLFGVDTVPAAEVVDLMNRGALPVPDAVVVANNTQLPPVGLACSARNLSDAADATALDVITALCVAWGAALPGRPTVLLCGGGFFDDHELGVPFRHSHLPTLAATARALDLPTWGPLPGTRYQVHPGGAITEDTHPAVILEEFTPRSPPRSVPLRAVLPPLQADAWHPTLTRVQQALNTVVPALLAHPAGRAILATHHHAGRWMGPRRLLVQLLGGPGEQSAGLALDLSTARFEHCAQPTQAPHDAYPFGIVVHAQDLDALLRGDLLVWDVLGVALRHWSAAGPGLPAFLCAWASEAVRPVAMARVLCGQLAALGVHIDPDALLAPATEDPTRPTAQ